MKIVLLHWWLPLRTSSSIFSYDFMRSKSKLPFSSGYSTLHCHVGVSDNSEAKIRLYSLRNMVDSMKHHVESLENSRIFFSKSLIKDSKNNGVHDFEVIIDSLKKNIINSAATMKLNCDQSNNPSDSDSFWLTTDPYKPSFTENGAMTFQSSGSARLDLFFKVMENSNENMVETYLERSWAENSLDTLQIIANLRDIRKGKGNKEISYIALSWLLENHPLTTIENLSNLLKIGYWKDILELLQTRCLGQPYRVPKQQGKGLQAKKAYKKQLLMFRKQKLSQLSTIMEEKEAYLASRRNENALKNQIQKYEARVNYLQKRQQKISVANLFAKELKKDLNRLNKLKEGRSFSSLGAKWAPSRGGSHDRNTLIVSTIAELLYPSHIHKLEEESYDVFLERIRSKYMKEYITPLRKESIIPETFMASNRWAELPYNRVPSVCMKNHQKHFKKHDQERFEKYLEDVKSGEVKQLPSGGLKPNELLKRLDSLKSPDETTTTVAELQWKSYVNNMKSQGQFSSCLAVCDVSGSMEGTPMFAAISMSLLISELSSPPFQNVVCTFSNTPSIEVVRGNTLMERYNSLIKHHWSTSTNLNAVFELILKRAIAAQLSP
eukprot:gene16977-23320_t